MLKLETLADLEQLIKDDIQESLTLEYKASDSLGRGNAQRNELVKNVSAFANSAGGQIVYGIEEVDHKPIRVDGGPIRP
jgi:predicted HTH transcriptional regulator